MEEYIKFFIELGKLKTIQRRGWLLRGIKNPESVADHAFRVLILTWIFGKETNLNIKRLLKLALVHSLSAVYIDYISPYNILLDLKGRKEIIKKYPALALRAPVDQKGKIAKKRFEEEKKAVEKLTKHLPESINHEIKYLWADFQQRSSREAKFLRALDKIENLIQAFEYKDKVKEDILTSFLVQIREVTYDKRLLKFIENLEIYIRKGKGAVKNKLDRNLIEFILKIGKLKEVKRKGWILRGVKNPESIASHSFLVAFSSWVFSRSRRLDQEAMIVMSLLHNVFSAEIGDHTPHDVFLEKLKDIDRVIETFPWIGLKQEKEIIMRDTLQKESDAIDLLLKYLPHYQRHELKYLWLEFKTGTSREGRYTRQVDHIETVLQAMEYHKEDKNISPTSFWLGLKEVVDDPTLLRFVEALDKHYYSAK